MTRTPSRQAIWYGYKNLSSVGEGTRGYGAGIKGVGTVLLVGSLLVILFWGIRNSWALGIGVVAFVFGIALHVIGTFVAAVGEAMLAVKDIAVNTRIVADRAERDRG